MIFPAGYAFLDARGQPVANHDARAIFDLDLDLDRGHNHDEDDEHDEHDGDDGYSTHSGYVPVALFRFPNITA